MTFTSLLALVAGAAIAVQATMNARLGVLLHSPIQASAIAFGVSCMVMLLTSLLIHSITSTTPTTTSTLTSGWQTLLSVPIYLWFSGGVLAALGVSLFYFLIPRMGIGPMMSYALSSQLLIAITASHFGWFDLPVKSLNPQRLLGVFSLIIGIVLINKN